MMSMLEEFPGQLPSSNEGDAATPTTDDPIDHVRRMILERELAPGAKLREAELAARFSLSRTPVREALVALEREGLVTYEKNRGFSVRNFSLRDLYESYEMRALMEGYVCCVVARQGMPPAQIAEMRACVAEVEASLQRPEDPSNPSVAVWRQANRRFHAILMNQPLSSLLRRTHDNVGRVVLMHDWFTANRVNAREAMRRFNRDHSQIVDAIENRDSGRAEFLMREHVMQACRELSVYMESSSGGRGSPEDNAGARSRSAFVPRLT